MRNFLATNLRLKVMALAFAIALWFFVAGQSKTEVGVLVPLSLKGVPRDMVMTSMPPGDIEVRVTGPRLFMANLSPAQISAELDMSGGLEGLNAYKIQSTDITTPMGIDVLRFRPNSIEVRLEKLSKTELPVRVRVVGRPAQGYRVAEVQVVPKTVTAIATKRELKDIGAVFTKPLDVSGRDSSKSMSVELDTAGGALRGLSSGKVDVKVIIRRERH
ncbi:MAG: YbbR-like domain-containing protein [Deltaproteobacteria bacterium]|nr:YbbR-like domain-containing protein [Deltaproteobacteria bacterium]